MLTLHDVSKSYAGRKILSGLSYTLHDGEYVAVMGESGVGKSTLLNLIAGLDAPDAGDIVIDGVSLAGIDDDAATRLRRKQMGFVFQAFHILPHLTLAQNVALPLLLNRAPPQQRVLAMLEAVGLGPRADDFPRQLSGGELQRVAIARALVHRPRVLLADEPTGNLDPDTAADVLELLRREIKQNGGCAIMVTHSPVAAASADRVLLLTRTGLQPHVPKGHA
ncbi:MAG TPA: ABC transporter ATP-binding protein [Noviherbaspirillum sp.]|nr:ABC transporter ATP-binding protein [Noviherbaspirillum sp.]